MRFLANENVPGPVVRTLRELGHDVLWAKEELAGQADHVLLSRAQSEQRVTVTCDPDFGELAFHSSLPAACGVVLFRIEWSNPQQHKHDDSGYEGPDRTPEHVSLEVGPPLILIRCAQEAQEI